MTDRDIVDEIDALVDEQLEAGEPRVGYDHGDPQFPNCPHCGRHWHGLPLTLQVAVMYGLAVYDDDYDASKDQSPIVCHGSESDQPMPEFTDEMRELAMKYTAIILQRLGRIPEHIDAEGMVSAFMSDLMPASMRRAPRIVNVFIGEGHQATEDRATISEFFGGWHRTGALREDGPPALQRPRAREGDRITVFMNGRAVTGELRAAEGNTLRFTPDPPANPSYGHRPGFALAPSLASRMTPADIQSWVAGEGWQSLLAEEGQIHE